MHALLVFPATSYRVEPFVAAAGELGLALELATDLPAAARAYGLPIHRVDFSSNEPPPAFTSPLSGVVGVDERSAALAARIAKKVAGLHYHSLRGVQAAADKRLMRRMLLEAGVPVPHFTVLASDSAPPVGGYPCVVKPPMLSGSQGVIRVDDDASLNQAVAQIRRILARHSSPLRTMNGFYDLLIEDFVAGPEVALDGIMHDGALEMLALFDKPDPLEGPYFEETTYVTPSRHPAATIARIEEVARNAALALGLHHGPIHAELRLGNSGPVLIEIAARSIGGLCSRALEHQVGSLERRVLRAAVGLEREPLPARRADRSASGVMMIPVPRSGVLKRVSGVDEARHGEGIDGITITTPIGTAIRTLPEGQSYLGFIFAHGAAPAIVEQRLAAAHSALRFELTPLLTLA